MSLNKTYFPDFIGNKKLIEYLSRCIANGTLGHAYIIEGAVGTGRHKLARSIAAAVNCLSRDESDPIPCGKCAMCRKIMADNCVDVTFVRREEDKVRIGIDSIREMCRASELVTAESDVGVFIIEDAHLMNANAQNALLKTLEEPTPHVMILLLTDDSTQLLETVQSRAPVLKLEQLTDDDVEKVVLAEMKTAANLKKREPEKYFAAIKHADGSAGKALALLRKRSDDGSLPLALAKTILGKPDGKKTEIFAKLPAKSVELQSVLIESGEILRDLLVVKRDKGAPMLRFDAPEEAADIAASFSVALICQKIDAVKKAAADLDANVSPVMVLTGLI